MQARVTLGCRRVGMRSGRCFILANKLISMQTSFCRKNPRRRVVCFDRAGVRGIEERRNDCQFMEGTHLAVIHIPCWRK